MKPSAIKRGDSLKCRNCGLVKQSRSSRKLKEIPSLEDLLDMYQRHVRLLITLTFKQVTICPIVSILSHSFEYPMPNNKKIRPHVKICFCLCVRDGIVDRNIWYELSTRLPKGETLCRFAGRITKCCQRDFDRCHYKCNNKKAKSVSTVSTVVAC